MPASSLRPPEAASAAICSSGVVESVSAGPAERLDLVAGITPQLQEIRDAFEGEQRLHAEDGTATGESAEGRRRGRPLPCADG